MTKWDPKTIIRLFPNPRYTLYNNNTGFRRVSRQQQDSFRNKLFPTFFGAFLLPFLLTFFGPAFWCTFLSALYKRCAILSNYFEYAVQKYVAVLRGGGGGAHTGLKGKI